MRGMSCDEDRLAQIEARLDRLTDRVEQIEEERLAGEESVVAVAAHGGSRRCPDGAPHVLSRFSRPGTCFWCGVRLKET